MNSKGVTANLPTRYGNFEIKVWKAQKGQEPIALITHSLNVKKPVVVRIHSECITGDTFGSLQCDCGQQKEKALKIIADSKNGVFVYLRQEGRDIGLFEKIKAFKLQEQGYDTYDANILLGHYPDPRDYTIGKKILKELGVSDIKIITNNPTKINQLREFGFHIIEQIPLIIRSNKYNKKYLEIKRVKQKHFYGKENSKYHFGIANIKHNEEIKTIAFFVQNRIKDPFVRIAMGIYANNSYLENTNAQKTVEVLFKYVEEFSQYLTPILHYTFKNSNNYRKDIKQLKAKFPFVKLLQLNDLEKDHLKLLKYASRYFHIRFPLTNNLFSLLENPEFIRIVKNRKVIVLLDNSGGKGKKEPVTSFKKNIQECLNNGINNICLAGGFGPDQLETYFQLKNYFKINFSIDAETKLKTNNTLDLHKAKAYLLQLLKPTNKVLFPVKKLL